VVSLTTGGALTVLAFLFAAAACGEISKTGAQSGNEAGDAGNSGSSSTGGSGGSSTTDGGEAGEPANGGTTSTGGVGGSIGDGGAAAGAAAAGGASGAAASGGMPAECEGAKSLEGDLVVSVGVETDELVRSISGNLTLYATVKDFRQFRCLENIGGSLRVTVGSGAEDLEALARLRSVGSDVIIEDTSYTSLAGLRSLSAFPFHLTIERNRKLVDLTGLEGLTGVTILQINSNPALSNIEALSNMTGEASDIYITMNDELENLVGLDGFRGVTTNLNISDNTSLLDLAGLDGIESIGGGAYFQNNPLLSTCEVEDFVARCEPSGGSVIDGNAPCN
jgi:hypothetical protein